MSDQQIESPLADWLVMLFARESIFTDDSSAAKRFLDYIHGTYIENIIHLEELLNEWLDQNHGGGIFA